MALTKNMNNIKTSNRPRDVWEAVLLLWDPDVEKEYPLRSKDMTLPRTTLSLLILCILIRSSLQQNCYFPNGVIARNDYPCTDLINNAPGIQVHCCEVGRTCLPNRMCSGNSQDENPMRGTCTDSTWDSPNCPKFCTPYSRLGKMYNCTSTTGVLLNNDVAFCCVDTGPNCCNNQTEVFVANDWDFKASAAEVATTRGTTTSLTVTKALTTSSWSSSSGSSLSLSTTGSSSSDFSTPLSPAASELTYGISSVVTITEGDKNVPTSSIATPVPASTNAAPADSSTSKRDWTGIGIGASVGAAVPLLALKVVGVLLWRRHRRRRSMFGSPSVNGYPRDSALTGTTRESLIRSAKPEHLKAYEAGGVQTYELDSVRERAELPLKSPRELPGSEGERQRYQAAQLRGHSDPYQPA